MQCEAMVLADFIALPIAISIPRHCGELKNPTVRDEHTVAIVLRVVRLVDDTQHFERGPRTSLSQITQSESEYGSARGSFPGNFRDQGLVIVAAKQLDPDGQSADVVGSRSCREPHQRIHDERFLNLLSFTSFFPLSQAS